MTNGQMLNKLSDQYGDLLQVNPHPQGIEIILDDREGVDSPAVFIGPVTETLRDALEA